MLFKIAYGNYNEKCRTNSETRELPGIKAEHVWRNSFKDYIENFYF